MKTIAFTLFLALSGAATTAFTPAAPATYAVPAGEICFTVKNDTGDSVTLHTGKGTAPMPNGSSKEFCIAEGGKLYLAERGQKGKVLVEVTAKVSGQKLKLSDLM